ncbi:GNAT family N-acetyltransferase [Streptomyces sp. NBC_01530]|uniref:GNAT family N-acetyltransferase n=1 Tax=Streptomyces sp. NBC_01530 TaxID=2903895 RepID=UPI003863E29A
MSPRTTGPEDACTAEPYLPDRGGLPALRKAGAGCRGCPLHRDATRTVFGEGDAHARVMLVGEQPGDQEDRHCKPFVGPAGRLLDRALGEAGIDPADAYVTNAVKHFNMIWPGIPALYFRAGQLTTHRLMTHWVWLYTVMVHPRHQGRGYGRDLLAAAADAVRGFPGTDAIRLTCRGGNGLERFYGSCGYQEAGRIPGAIRVAPGDDRDEVVMLLPLT